MFACTTTLTSPMNTLPGARAAVGPWRPGRTVLGRYVLLERLGVGQAGEVWHAQHARLGLDVAIKRQLMADPARALDAHSREVWGMSRVSHPNLIGLIDMGEEEGRGCLVMELAQGRAVDTLGVLSWWQVGLILAQTLDALGALHRAGVMHGDIKPEHVLVSHVEDQGVAWQVQLVDLGMARTTDGRLPDGRTIKTLQGTLAYMAPEALLGEAVGPRAEQYAVGLIAYELLTGAALFGRQRVSQLLERAQRPAPWIFEDMRGELLPRPVASVVARLLERDEADRFANASVAAAALRHAMTRSVQRRASEQERVVTGACAAPGRSARPVG